MANNTYWGVLPPVGEDLEVLAPGEFEDNGSTENAEPAVWLGDCLVEGTPDEWTAFAAAILAVDWDEVENRQVQESCVNCDEEIEMADGRPQWIGYCESCVHNAERSGA